MKFKKIKLHNFLSHADTEIDIDGISAAVLLGPNGSGKTSLLSDALTWALFGKSRYSDIDKNLKIGKVDGEVLVEFVFNDKKYQILRKRSLKTRRGKSELFFGEWSNDRWVPLCGSTIAETEAKISQLLHLDYKSFLAAVLATEENNNFFASCDPAERKRILWAMLDLDRYQKLAVLAAKKANLINTDKIDAQIEFLVGQLAEEENIKGQRIALQEQYQSNLLIQEKLQSQLADLRKQYDQHNLKLGQQKEITGQIEANQGELSRLKDRILKRNAESAQYLKLLGEEDIICQAEGKRTELENEKSSLLHKTNNLIDELNKIDTVFSSQQKIIDKSKEKLSFKKGETILIEGTVKTLHLQLEEAEMQAAILVSIPCPREYQNKCPAVAHAIKASQSIDSLRETIACNLLQVEQQSISTKELEAHLSRQLAKLDEIEQNKKIKKSNIGDIQKRSQQLEKEYQQAVRLANKMPAIQEAGSKIAMLNNQIAELNGQQNILVNKTTELQAKHDANLERELHETTETMHRSECALERIGKAIASELGEIKNLDLQLTNIKSLKKDLKEKQKNRDELAHEQFLYRILEQAFKMVPVLIFEHAKPIIEQTANQILTQLSPSGMQIYLPTQKAQKTVDTITETLEILVRDEIGEREFNALSSGEKVRASLALRIGLSELIQSRTGRIGLFIQDEGTGTLDAEGLDTLKECLNILHQNKHFDQLFLSTHIEELKNLFPTTIMVEKENGISKVNIL